MEAELRSQPETWARAVELRAEQKLLPAAGQRVAVVGCGTSWFMAQSYAALRETAGLGVTDAFAASETPGASAPFDTRDYDAIVAITRSGTTTEVLELLDATAGIRQRGSHDRHRRRPGDAAGRPRRRCREAAVRRRDVGGADPVRDDGARVRARGAGREPRRRHPRRCRRDRRDARRRARRAPTSTRSSAPAGPSGSRTRPR